MTAVISRRAIARVTLGGAACYLGWRAVHSQPPAHNSGVFDFMRSAGPGGSATSSAAAPSDATLGSTWATAIDGMMDVPGCEQLSSPDGILFMAPKASVEAPGSNSEKKGWFSSKSAAKEDEKKPAWPRIFSKSVVFSMTAWNPMGKDAPLQQNVYRNQKLEKELDRLKPEPRAIWHSYGFNAQEGWREDGFSIAYAHEERIYGKVAILKLARKYEQLAVYMYTVDKESGELVREVLWVDALKHEEHGSKETMSVLKAPPSTPLADPNYWMKLHQAE